MCTHNVHNSTVVGRGGGGYGVDRIVFLLFSIFHIQKENMSKIKYQKCNNVKTHYFLQKGICTGVIYSIFYASILHKHTSKLFELCM